MVHGHHCHCPLAHALRLHREVLVHLGLRGHWGQWGHREGTGDIPRRDRERGRGTWRGHGRDRDRQDTEGVAACRDRGDREVGDTEGTWRLGTQRGHRDQEDREVTGTAQVTAREGTRSAWDVPGLEGTQRGQDMEGTGHRGDMEETRSGWDMEVTRTPQGGDKVTLGHSRPWENTEGT